MRSTSLLTVVIILLAVRSAAATCMTIEDGCSVCCSGPDHCTTSCPESVIDWRPAASSRFELGISGVAATSEDTELGTGGRVSIAYHRLYAHREWTSGNTLWVFGNELGVELGAERVWDDGAIETQLSVTPILRVARASRFRTPSVFGVVLPEIGASLRPGAASQIFFRWSAFPIDVRLTRWLAITVDPLAAAVGIGGGTRWWLSSSIGLRVVR